MQTKSEQKAAAKMGIIKELKVEVAAISKTLLDVKVCIDIFSAA